MESLSKFYRSLVDGPALVAAIGLVAGLVYWPVLTTPELVDIDYDLVINVLRGVHGVGDYLREFVGPSLMDIQPVRDLSLLFDIWLGRLLGHQLFGLTNLLIWATTCYIVYLVTLRLTTRPIARVLAAATFLHPCLTWTISWPTARKHLLACLFLTLASYLAYRYKEERRNYGFAIFLCYFLAAFSQPIGLLWAPVLLVYLWDEVRERRHWYLLGACGLTLFLAGALNHVYFNQLYPLQTGVEKIFGNSSYSVGLRILSFSRSLFQILVPITFASDYSAQSIASYLGLPLAVLGAWLMSFRLSKRRLFFCTLLVLHPLLLINSRSTNIFVSDSYLLLSISGLAIVAGAWLGRTERENGATLFISFVTILFVFLSARETRIATDKRAYFEKSFEREPTCRNALSLANFYLQRAEFEPFYAVAGDALGNRCLLGGNVSVFLMSQVYAFRVYLDRELALEAKSVALSKLQSVSPAIAELGQLIELEKGAGVSLRPYTGRALAYPLKKLREDLCRRTDCEKTSL